MPKRSIGFIGAGQMGAGIAHVFAVAGFDVLLHDVEEARKKLEERLKRYIENQRLARDSAAASQK